MKFLTQPIITWILKDREFFSLWSEGDKAIESLGGRLSVTKEQSQRCNITDSKDGR